MKNIKEQNIMSPVALGFNKLPEVERLNLQIDELLKRASMQISFAEIGINAFELTHNTYLLNHISDHLEKVKELNITIKNLQIKVISLLEGKKC